MAACVPNQEKTFRWITDEESNAVVEYGISPEYGSTASGAVDVTEHSVALSSLSPDTIYYYLIGSTDSSGITVWGDQQTLETLAEDVGSRYE